MGKLTIINLVATLALAATLSAAPLSAVLAGQSSPITTASRIDIVPLLRLSPVEIAALYPALDGAQLDKLMMRIGERLSMAGID